MSIRQGNKVIAGHINYHPDLFDHKWADHMLNDVSWLRADTFSWQDGGVYKAAYQHLGSDIFNLFYGWENDNIIYYSLSQTPSVGDQIYTINSFGQAVAGYQVSAVGNNTITIFSTVSGVSVGVCLRDSTTDNYFPRWISDAPQTETVAGITIEFYLAPDGHKIVLSDQESNVASIYNATGVAWYYILDTTNQRFKLPRTQFGVTGLRDTVGKYVAPGLPNINGDLRYTVTLTDVSGAFTSRTGSGANKWGSGEWGNCNFAVLDASRSSSIYGNSATVQAPATQMYLYFYIGNFTQTALENTAGITAETLNDKLDLDAGNATSSTKQTVGGWCMPDYTTGVSKSWDTSYLADSDTMICYQTNHQSGNPNVTPQVSQDGSTWITLYGQNAGSSNFKIGGWFFCPKGWYWKMVGGRNVDRMLTAYSMKSAT